MARAGLRFYASFERGITGTEGDSFFALDPTPAEWTEAERLAKKYGVRAVILGHTHAARWGQKDGLVFANSGTWIWLMKLPAYDAGVDEWTAFLDELRQNPRLDPARQKVARTVARLTAVELDESPSPSKGTTISLLEWVPGDGIRSLGTTTLAANA